MEKPEFYHRISITYIPGDMQMKDDDYASISLNHKLSIWVEKAKKDYPNFKYRITNAEHSVIPGNPTFNKANPAIILALNIAYIY